MKQFRNLTTIEKRPNLAWVNDVEDHHHNQHQPGIENIDIDLMGHKLSSRPLYVFNYAVNTPDQNKSACGYKSLYMSFPWAYG